jgi:hypothetical protein
MMLTRRQTWRRQKQGLSRNQSSRNECSQHAAQYLPRSNDSDTNFIVTVPEFSASPSPRSITFSGFDGIDMCEKKPVKTVRFSNTAQVILVPARQEYHKHGVHHDIWYNSSDMKSFKLAAKLEFEHLVRQCRGNIGAAIRAFYWHPETSVVELKSDSIFAPAEYQVDIESYDMTMPSDAVVGR